MRARCVLANGLWRLSSLPAARMFERDAARVESVQTALLLQTLRANARTRFGVEHGFASIGSVAEYRQRVPVRTFDEFPAIEPADPVEHYEPTSGSSGAKKLIPYTRTLRAQFHAAIAPWIAGMFAAHPRAMRGEAYWSVSPLLPDAPQGYESDEDYLGPVQRRLARAVQAVPPSVRHARDLESFRAQTLEALTRCRSLALVSVWHPSFLELLVEPVRERIPELWPELAVVSCWADANAAAGAARLARLFPQATVVPKGLLSTEGFVTIPLPRCEAPALAYRSHFFEFRDGERTCTAAEVERGREYEVVLTTGAGLYRYATEDLVEVVGFRERIPLLRFVGRKSHVADHFGEKLNERFVRECLAAEGVSGFAMLAVAGHAEGNAYVLYLESEADDASLRALAARVETRLRAAHHYDLCRRLGQLAALRVFRVAPGTHLAAMARARNQRLGDVKPAALDRGTDWSARFDGHTL